MQLESLFFILCINPMTVFQQSVFFSLQMQFEIVMKSHVPNEEMVI